MIGHSVDLAVGKCQAASASFIHFPLHSYVRTREERHCGWQQAVGLTIEGASVAFGFPDSHPKMLKIHEISRNMSTF